MSVAGLTTHQLSDAVLKGAIKGAFIHKYEESKPIWKSCGFEEDTTKKPFEEYTSFSGIGLAPRKEQLQQIAIDVPKQNYTKRVNVFAYAIMVPVSEEMIRFWKSGVFSERPFMDYSEFVAQSMKETTEILCADIFANAFSTTVGLGPDGLGLVNSAHKLGRGGTASNYIGKVSLSESSLEAAIIQGRKMPADNGLPVGVGNGKRLLVTQEDELFNVARLLKSDNQAYTANNAINALKDQGIEHRTNRYLASASNWFIVNTGVKYGLMVLWETKPEMKEFGDDKIGAMNFRAYQMMGVDWFEWRRVQGSDF